MQFVVWRISIRRWWRAPSSASQVAPFAQRDPNRNVGPAAVQIGVPFLGRRGVTEMADLYSSGTAS